MVTLNELPETVHHRILKRFGARTLTRVGAIGKPGIAEAARGLMAERQAAVTSWCAARLTDFEAIHDAVQAAVWDGDGFRPGIAPRDDFLPFQDEIGAYMAAVEAAGAGYGEVTVRMDGMLAPGGNGRHRYAHLRVFMTASMPPMLDATDEGAFLSVSFYFGRDDAWRWQRIGAMRIRLMTPSMDVSWAVEYDPSVPLNWRQVSAAWHPVPYVHVDPPTDRRRYWLEQECIQDVPAMVRACWNDDVATLVATVLHAL